MENICPVDDRQFMCRAILEDGNVIDEYHVDDDGNIKDITIHDIIAHDNIKQFGLTGAGFFINFNTSDGIFEIVKNSIHVKLGNEEITDMLQIDKIKKLICYYTHAQSISKGVIEDGLIHYGIGYRIESDYLYMTVKVCIDKYKGWFLAVEITPKDDYIAKFEVIANNNTFAEKEIEFKKSNKFELELKIF